MPFLHLTFLCLAFLKICYALSLTGFICLNYLKPHTRGKAYCSSITELHPGWERKYTLWPSPSSFPLSPYFLHLSFSLISTLSISLTQCISCLHFPCDYICISPSQKVKRLSAVRETRVHSLGRKDPLEKEMATHSSVLAWEIPWMEEPGRLQSMGSQSWTRLSDFTFTFLSISLCFFSSSCLLPFNPFLLILFPFLFMPINLSIHSCQWERHLLDFPSFLISVKLTVSIISTFPFFWTIHTTYVVLTILLSMVHPAGSTTAGKWTYSSGISCHFCKRRQKKDLLRGETARLAAPG